MREFTKSMMSYTWAMTLFGVQQIFSVFQPAKTAESFKCVTKATEEEFGDALKATFHAGDGLQKGVIDVTLGALTLGMLERGEGASTSGVAQQTGEVLRQGGRAVSKAVDVLSQTVQSATSVAAAAVPSGAGWGAPPSMSREGPTTPSGSATSPRPAPPGEPPSGGGWGPMPDSGNGP